MCHVCQLHGRLCRCSCLCSAFPACRGAPGSALLACLTNLAPRCAAPPPAEGGSSGDGSGSESEGEGRPLTKLELRRQQRAAGAHPLQESFREQAAQLLKRHRRQAGGACARAGEAGALGW